MIDVCLQCSQCSHELTERQIFWLHVDTPPDSAFYLFDSEDCRLTWIKHHQPLLEKAEHTTKFEDTLEGLLKRPNVAII